MEFKQFYLQCLAHASYLVGDDGECAIVDPQRDVDGYIAEAEARGLKIAHIVETHLHADFVSGHIELAQRTGATIHVSHAAGARYPHRALREGDEIRMGSVVLRMLETPGHTPESVCLLVFDTSVSEQPLKVLTGDTLFIGDVGRPDLVGSKGYTAEDMAGLMYDSLRTKVMTLPDAVEVFPAHGAGSSCGRNISAALTSTIGEQKATNHALQPMTREQFIAVDTAGLQPPPAYFPHDAETNRTGAVPLAELPAPVGLEADAVAAARDGGAQVLDVRDRVAFGAGHVPGALNIGLGGMFASWCGTLLDLSRPLVLVADDDAGVSEAVLRLARVGLHDIAGHLAGGMPAWAQSGQAVETIEQVDVAPLSKRLADGQRVVLDVRGPGEHEVDHLPGAVNIPLPVLAGQLAELDPSRPVAVVCKSGYRSSAASGLLTAAGFGDVINVAGGTDAWREAGLPLEVGVAGASA